MVHQYAIWDSNELRSRSYNIYPPVKNKQHICMIIIYVCQFRNTAIYWLVVRYARNPGPCLLGSHYQFLTYDDIIKWKHFPRYWPFVRGIHRALMDSPHKVTRSFDVFFDLHLNTRLRKQSRRRWFETQSRSLWRHCNGIHVIHLHTRIRVASLAWDNYVITSKLIKYPWLMSVKSTSI